jgi:integrase/recombinase XerD
MPRLEEVIMNDIVNSVIDSIRRGRDSWLKEAVRGFLNESIIQGLKKTTLRIDASRVFLFGEFAKQQGVQTLGELPQQVELFLIRFYPQQPALGIWRSTLGRFLRHLMRMGLIPTPQPESVPVHPDAHLVAEYMTFLREHRGICTQYARDIKKYCLALITFVSGDSHVDWPCLSAKVLHDFLVTEGKMCARVTMSRKCSSLRGFLTYLHRQGVVPQDYSAAMISPKVYAHEQCPRFLTEKEVKAVLSAISRLTPRGRRNYAMMMLLSVYGLRGIEVIRLRLDEIDWRNQRLLIRSRKAGNSTTYPLAPSVGEAFLDYLQAGRPEVSHREVFLSIKPPFLPLRSTSALGRLTRKFMVQVNVQVERPGTHTFRYSCAQRLLEGGIPLKSVGDFLGHRNPDSTQRYTKIALSELRQVALSDAEDLL